MTYGPSHAYEQYYQAVRRMWRFGQANEVLVDVITTEGGRSTLASLDRKATQADDMFTALISHMSDALRINRTHTYNTTLEVPTWLAS